MMTRARFCSPPPLLPADRRRSGRRASRSRRPHGEGGDRERLHAAQLRRPEDGRGDRLGIRRLQRDRQAAEPQGRMEPVELGHHDPGGARGPVRRRHGRHHHQRRAQGAGRLLRPLHESPSSSCWCAPTRAASPTPRASPPNKELLVGAQAGTTNFYIAVYNVLDGDEANPRIKLFDTFGASVQALKSGDVDHVLMDKTSAAGYIGASPGRLQGRRRAARHGGVRLHLQARLRPRRAGQRRDRRR